MANKFFVLLCCLILFVVWTTYLQQMNYYYIIGSLAPILHLFGRHFVVGWAPLCSKKIICEMLNFTDSTCNNDSSLQINDSK